MTSPVIHLTNIGKKFGKKTVFDNLSLTLNAGTVFGLVGLNGAGKTTLIRIMLGLLKVDAGQCSILGTNPWCHDSTMYRLMGVVLEHNGFWGNLTVRQNLAFFAKARGISIASMEQYFNEHWTHTAIAAKTQKTRYFSRGEKVQCAVCRAFMGWPQVYLLDEPAVALDIKAYDHFCSMVRQARERGATLVISSHQLDAIEDLCDYVGILENGGITMLETTRNKRQRWLIRTDNRPECGACIAAICGAEPVYLDGSWQFEIEGSSTDAIGVIVAKLVGLGCQITEVVREKSDLRQSLRHYYDTPSVRVETL